VDSFEQARIEQSQRVKEALANGTDAQALLERYHETYGDALVLLKDHLRHPRTIYLAGMLAGVYDVLAPATEHRAPISTLEQVATRENQVQELVRLVLMIEDGAKLNPGYWLWARIKAIAEGLQEKI
jgi:hypothetical protein